MTTLTPTLPSLRFTHVHCPTTGGRDKGGEKRKGKDLRRRTLSKPKTKLFYSFLTVRNPEISFGYIMVMVYCNKKVEKSV